MHFIKKKRELIANDKNRRSSTIITTLNDNEPIIIEVENKDVIFLRNIILNV